MPTIHYEDRDFTSLPAESVLDCLLRNGVPVSWSCRSGVCQACLLKGTGGVIPARAQAGLKDTLRAQGYFLACSCYPAEDIRVSAGADQRIPARIRSLEHLNGSVLRVRLDAGGAFDYRAGQYVSLFRNDGLARSFSLASLPADGELELHVRRVPGGIMSQWLHDQARENTEVLIQGPAGNCFYVEGNPEQPLLLAGTGTGLAPLYGIARDALARGHVGPIWLFHGALDPKGLYLSSELRALAVAYTNFHYVPTVLRPGEADSHPEDSVTVGELDGCILARFPKLTGWKAYVCGDPAIVNLLRKKIFLAGAASSAIYADAFIPAQAPLPTPVPAPSAGA